MIKKIIITLYRFMNKKFWQTKTLAEMTSREWESLCDGCGQCCLHKLDDGRDMVFSNISCHLLDGQLANAKITKTEKTTCPIACN